MKLTFFRNVIVLVGLATPILLQAAPRQAPLRGAQAEIMLILQDQQVPSIIESTDAFTRENLGTMVSYTPIAADGLVKRHYQIDRFTVRSTGLKFTLFHSYLDSEDGGNTYGWVEDVGGNVIARIADGFFASVRVIAHSQAEIAVRIGSLPQVLEQQLELDDHQAINNLLIDLVERYENKLENPTAADGEDLDIFVSDNASPCKVSRSKKSLVCEVDYLQDRWNGTVNAIFKIKNGKIVSLRSASFEGNY